MQILAITQYADLLERLRTAFEARGHGVTSVPDPLRALAHEAWRQAQLILVDAEGEPLDGYRLCHLFRAESAALFRNLPILLILDHPPGEDDLARLLEAEGDGFLEAHATPTRLLQLLGPFVDGTAPPRDAPPEPLLACGLEAARLQGLREGVAPLGFVMRTCTPAELAATIATERTPILFLGADAAGDEAQAILQGLPALPHPPYPILVGDLPGEALQARLLGAGELGWLDLPLSAPKVGHRVRRALEWLHAKRVQRECHLQINGLVERRVRLETETQALRNEVLTDSLTELLNRRAFNQNLDHAVNQWVRHARPFALILGDLDYFKLINDRFGHPAGDEVLKAVSQRIRASLRRSDLAFRIGGEEFAILLTETQLASGLDVADKIRRRIDESPVTLTSGQTVFPTMSFGIGGPEGPEAGALFSRVDQALYAAKHKGRNRVEVVEPGQG
jgi:diguanylate cyclase (GGDEF)-like protein